MLYVIHKRNPNLQYQGGQDRIVHLVSTVGTAVKVVGNRQWAFSDGNAGATYTRFTNDLARFHDFVDLNAVQKRDWSDPVTKNRKQAEFLVYQSFPWEGFTDIGVIDKNVANDVEELLADEEHCPRVLLKRDWYY
jgi:hypothetical protein